MSAPTQNNQAQPENKPSDKELNFRAIEAKLAQERASRGELEKENERLRQAAQRAPSQDEDDRDDEPYVDHKKLTKQLNKFGQSTQSDIQRAMETAKNAAKDELRQEMWLENNPDFYEVLQHADKLAEKSPALANSILKMPDNFERQKLVYQNIKELGVHKGKPAEPSIQQKIDANRKSPYYQPSGTATAPYSQVGDFSEQGQKQAYEKLQALKKNLRI
jgi:hypothetical protein